MVVLSRVARWVGSPRLRIRLAVADAKNSLQLAEFAHALIAPGSTIRSAGAYFLRALGDQGFTHELRVMSTSPEPAHEYMPGVHLVASLLKSWIAGTLHHAHRRHRAALRALLDSSSYPIRR